MGGDGLGRLAAAWNGSKAVATTARLGMRMERQSGTGQVGLGRLGMHWQGRMGGASLGRNGTTGSGSRGSPGRGGDSTGRARQHRHARRATVGANVEQRQQWRGRHGVAWYDLARCGSTAPDWLGSNAWDRQGRHRLGLGRNGSAAMSGQAHRTPVVRNGGGRNGSNGRSGRARSGSAPTWQHRSGKLGRRTAWRGAAVVARQGQRWTGIGGDTAWQQRVA